MSESGLPPVVRWVNDMPGRWRVTMLWSELACVGSGGCDECGAFEVPLYRDRGDVSLLPEAYCVQCIRPDDGAVCEECDRVVPFTDPVFPWDHNSMRVCGPCGVRIRAEYPEGDE